MDVIIRDRTNELQAQLRAYVDKKVRALSDYIDLASSAEVEFDRDVKKRPEPLHVVKITLHVLARRTHDLRVKEIGRDQRVAFDLAMTRIGAQAAELKARIKAHP